MTSPASHTPPLTAPMILLMSLATGLAVASNYYAQPLLHHRRAVLAVQRRRWRHRHDRPAELCRRADAAGAPGRYVRTARPDRADDAVSSASLLVSAFAPNITVLMLGTALTGMLSVVAQILVPFAATLALPHERGKAVGTVMSGLLLGILLARTFAGVLADLAAGAPCTGGVPADAGHVRRAVARAAAPPEPGGTELSAPAGLDPAHVRR